MSGIIRMILLLALAVCVCQAQLVHNTESCLCRVVRPRLVGSPLQIKDIQIYRETTFCPRVEIQVTMMNGHRFCLDPSKKVSRVLNSFMKK